MDKNYTLTKPIQASDEHEEDTFVAGEGYNLVPEGTYQVCCTKIEKGRSHSNSYKMFVWCIIIEPGQYYEKELFMALNLIDTRTGKPFKKVPRGSKYYKQWVIANNNNLPSRNNRMSYKIFKSGVFEAVVRTVKPKFKDGTEMPDCFHYSVIDYLKRKLS